ncbi:fatty acyl-CoA reductase 1-like [Belonocnema kinseyi]|uniref:fatty acyl-CoA reductase 1-like n=1 Tax=Belonocnema kinseyi TaxID=2817044 RepID=UPI00143D6869|nr:fatty acyl-CoA reductase 1-like [Belonocnema kinseyi]
MSLHEWFGDREVLLTGVTSEVGRILLEKVLRTFPELKVHAVLRSRFGYSKDDRVKKIFASPGYERLRQKDPNAISRVKALEGNILYEGLGLSKQDKATLRKVSVVLHAAGPHDYVLDFCQELPNLRAVAAASNLFRYRGQISETILNEKVPDVPLAIVRFPIIGPVCKEPMPGYVEILKGPTALMVGAGYAFGHSDCQAELIPADLAGNTLIAAAWERGLRSKSDKPSVYNATTIGCTWDDLIQQGYKWNQKFAYPTFSYRGMTLNAMLHWWVIFFIEWLPSVICDTVLSLFGAKQRIVAEHVRVRNALRSLESVASKPWSVERNHVNRLQKRLSPEDQETFPLVADIDVESYVLCAAAASRKYCVDETSIKIVRVFTRILLSLIFVALSYILLIFFKP